MSRFLTSRWTVRAVCACAVVILAGSREANAAAFGINDPADTPPQIGVGANDFEQGLYINGSLFQQGLASPVSGSVAGETVNFDGEWVDLGASTPLTRTVYFIKPGTADQISDILQYTVETDGLYGHIFGSFVSNDDPGGLGVVPAGTDPSDTWIAGSGNFYFTAAYLGGVVATVPEPVSLVLLGLGGLLLRRR